MIIHRACLRIIDFVILQVVRTNCLRLSRPDYPQEMLICAQTNHWLCLWLAKNLEKYRLKQFGKMTHT